MTNPTPKPSSNLLYLDTNEYNKLCDSNKLEKTINYANEISQRGYEIVLSPINIYEIISTRDEERREKLIFLLQHICSENLLVDIEYLIIDFIVMNLNNDQLNDLTIETPFHQTPLSLIWKDVKNNKSNTFSFDTNTLEKFEIHKLFTKLFYSLINCGLEWLDAIHHIEILTSNNKSEIKNILENTISNLPKNKNSINNHPLKDGIMFFISKILITGLTLNPEPIDNFWSKNNIFNIEEKIEYIQDNLNFLFGHGPFVGMGFIASQQVNQSYSRGNFFDCYHIAYLPYVDFFVTSDNKLLEIIKQEGNVSLFNKVVPDINNF